MATSRSRIATALVALLPLASACAVVGDVLHGTRDRIVFSHQEHLFVGKDAANKGKGHGAEGQMCASCHFPTPKDFRGEEPVNPLEASCLACHQEWKAKNECWRCHTDASKPLTYKKDAHANIKFSHARHNERVARMETQACDFCHKSAWQEGKDSGGVRLAQDAQTTWHETCFKCHLMKTEWDRMNCSKCHATLSDKEGALRPMARFRHEGNWLEHHGDELIGRPYGIALCSKCHDRGYCNDCHDARDERRLRPELKWPDRPDRQFIHRGDFINRHAFEARTQPGDCLRCHAAGGFCKSCHEERGLTIGSRQLDPNGTGGRTRYTADGQTDPILQYHNGTYAQFVINPASPLHHSRSARRDATLCASCHDYGRQSVCIDCHADPAVKAPRVAGGNPHPKGFKSSIPKSQKPCSYCHVNAGVGSGGGGGGGN